MSRSHSKQIDELKIHQSYQALQLQKNYYPLNIKKGYVQYDAKNINLNELSGWKFHISVHPQSLHQALPLVLGVLTTARLQFKFKIPNAEKSGHTYDESQFTIYLTADFTTDKMNQLISSLTKDFKENKIIPSRVLPASDCLTASPYFSFRNDSFVFFGSAKSLYLSSRHVGKHFNPCNYNNPYQEKNGDKALKTPFNFQVHFERFECKNTEQARVALLLSAYAYLNEYCKSLVGLDDEIKKEPPDLKKFVKDEYQDHVEKLDLHNGIYFCMQIILYEQWLKIQHPENSDAKHFSACSFLPLTGYADQIKKRAAFFMQLKAIEDSLIKFHSEKPESEMIFSFKRFVEIFQKEDAADEHHEYGDTEEESDSEVKKSPQSFRKGK